MRFTGTLLILLALSGCGSDAKKPTDADIAAYLAQSSPNYLHVSGVKSSFTAAKVAGSWRVKVDFTLHATEDLYGPQSNVRAMRADFDHAVANFEQYRVARIAAVDQLARQVGLMKPGDAAPEPAVPVMLITHAKQDLADSVTLLAQPDGAGWKFFQLDAQTLPEDAIGAPLADVRAASPHTVFVMAGSDEDRAYAVRRQRFLAAVAKAAQQPAP